MNWIILWVVTVLLAARLVLYLVRTEPRLPDRATPIVPGYMVGRTIEDIEAGDLVTIDPATGLIRKAKGSKCAPRVG